MLRSYRGQTPRLGPGVYVDPSAQVIGDVEIGQGSSVWMGCVVRGDVNRIEIGERSNLQDASVVHVQSGGIEGATSIGDDVTVGHGVILHGCTIEDGCLIGMGARVLDRAVVRSGSLVAAGALVLEEMEVPAGTLVAGLPARVVRALTRAEIDDLRRSAARYVEYARDYVESDER